MIMMAQAQRTLDFSGLSAAEVVSYFQSTLTPQNILVLREDEVMARLDDLVRRLDDPALREELAPSLIDIEGSLNDIRREYMGTGDVDARLMQTIEDTYMRVRMQRVPEREEETMPAGVAAYTSEPRIREVTPPTAVPVQYMPENVLEMEFPTHWNRAFATETLRNDTAAAWSDGVIADLAEDPRAAEFGATVVGNMIEGVPGGISREDFLAGNWTDEQRDFIMSRFGKREWTGGAGAEYKDEILRMLNFINEGRFIEAMNTAASDTTIARMTMETIEETINQRGLDIRVPVFLTEISTGGRVYENEYIFIAARAFAQLVVTQRHTMRAEAQRDEVGNITSLSIDLVPTDNFDTLGGGGAAAELGILAGHELRYVSARITASYDAYLQRPVVGGTLIFADDSGNWTTPLDGQLYPMVYIGYDSEGRLRAGGRLELGGIFTYGDHSMFVSLNADYIKDFMVEDGVFQTDEFLLLTPGIRYEWERTFSIEGNFIWDPLNRQIGASATATVDIARGTELEVGYRWMQVRVYNDFDVDQHMLTIGINTDIISDLIREAVR